MPGFVGHTTGNALVFVGTTAMMASQGWSLGDIIAVDAGIAFATLALSPDMDLFNSRSMEDWGLMRIFWWPYAKMVKHRDMMHLPIIGTTVRWLYLAIVLAIVILPIAIILRRMNISVTFQGDTEDILWYLGYLVDVLIGAALADAMHYVLDMISTRLKRLLPKRYRERYAGYVQTHNDQHRYLHPSYADSALDHEQRPFSSGDNR